MANHAATWNAVLLATTVSSSLFALYSWREMKKLRKGKPSEVCDSDTQALPTTENASAVPLEPQSSKVTDGIDGDRNSFIMQEIGRIRSPFPQRAGCPRQGGYLAPHIRSKLVFRQNMPKEMLDGIMTYSHVWIIFRFHLNPLGKASSKRNRTGKSKFTATKIRPPRAKGQKVGVLATRAPHRPNPVGLSIGLIQQVTTVMVQGKKHVCLVLRGLDLVDNTPVYDIKPFVPWDRVESLDPCTSTALHERIRHLVVPEWVSADDELPSVNWSDDAKQSLFDNSEQIDALYDDPSEALQAISEIAAQDPRAIHDGRGKRSEEDFDFTFGGLRISFRADGQSAQITQVRVDEGDLSAAPGSYPHNLALRRKAEGSSAKKLVWANPVREGTTDGLFDLKNGGTIVQHL